MAGLRGRGHMDSNYRGCKGLNAVTQIVNCDSRFSILDFRFPMIRKSKIEHPKSNIHSKIECHIEPVEVKSKHAKHLKAFTLLESVTAITIITILIGVSAMIYSNVVESEKPMAFYQAKQDLSKIYQNTKTNQAFFTKSFSFENYDIQQEVAFYKGNKKLYQINYTITSKGEIWWSENHLVANKYNAL